MTYYVYSTLNIVNYKQYIGITKNPIETGYVGSGRLITKAIAKYGKHLFVRTDLFSGDLIEASKMERFYTDYFNATQNKDFYNLRHGGFDGPHGKETRELMSSKAKSTWKMKREKYVKAFKNRDSTNIGKYDKSGESNPMFGRSHSHETRRKLSEAKTGQKIKLTDERRKALIKQIKTNTIMMGNKTNKQKAKNRWAALSKSFMKEPVIGDDIRMMHDFYGFHESMKELSNEHLEEYLKFRFRFLQEELGEGLKAIDERNAEEVCDSLVDLIVVAVGTLDLFQVNFKKSWYSVLTSNMKKMVGIKASRPNKFGLPDLVKPEGWVGPSHENNHGIIGKIFRK